MLQESGCGSYTGGCGQQSMGAVTLPETVYSYGAQGYNPGYSQGLIQGYNPGLSQGYNPGLSQIYSPGLSQGYNPGLSQGYNPGLPQGYNPGVPCLGNGCPGAQSTSAGKASGS